MSTAERLAAEGEAKGLVRGRQEGRQEGEARLLLRLIRMRFGAPPPDVVARIEAAPLADLERWSDRLLGAAILDDLFRD